MRAFHIICLWLCFSGIAHGLVQCSFEDRLISLSPGESGQMEIALFNPDPEPVTVRAYLEDWERTPEGAQQFYPAGTLPGSAAKQVQLAESLVELGPQQEGKLRLQVEAAKDQRGTRTAMLFVESGRLPMPAKAADKQMQISVQAILRYGIKLYVVARGTEEPGTKIIDCELKQPKSGLIPVSVELSNFGNVHLSYQGRLEVRTVDGEAFETVNLAPFSILPGASRKVGGEVRLPPAGKYLLLAVLDYGGQSLLAAEAPFEIRGESQ